MAMDRVKNEHSIHDSVKDAGPHHHRWRILICEGGRDTCECSICGEQDTFPSNFDDDYS